VAVIDLAQVFLGKLVFALNTPAMDDVRFERVLRGFGGHYLVNPHSGSRFSFERGEGFVKFDKFDPFAAIDRGEVERLHSVRGVDEKLGENSNVIAFAPRFGGLHFRLGVQVMYAVWLLLAIFGFIAVGGDPMWWIVGFLTVYGVNIALVRISLRRKINRWLAPETWN
jgi:hypothetical protein